MVNGFLYANAACRPDHAALVYGERRIGYAELLGRVERTAHGLASRGIRAGDAVALVLPNGPDFVTAFFAVGGLGAVAVPLNPQFRPDELTFCMRACDVRAVIADRPLPAAGEDGVQWLTPGNLLGSESLALEICSAEEPFVSMFSSGSTGRPKRLTRTHGQLWAEAESYRWIHPEDRLFCAIPLFHTYALGCCLIATIRNGATLAFLDDSHPFVLSRRRALDLLEGEAVTVFPAVPFTFRLLADAPGEADLSMLRLCFSAGTALPRPTFDAFALRFGVPIRQLYGSTETGTLTANLDDDPAASFASVGKPVGDVRVEIRDDGEIAVSSPAMTRGYADMDELNQRVFRDGWYLTGDLGRLDDEGRLFVTGRKKLLIEVAGHKVDPVEVEDVVVAHPKVREAVVVAVAGGSGGEQAVKAVVVAGDGCGEQEVIEFCRARLANFKVPRVVEFRDEIPKSPLGKILRKYLV
jgi:long-chain acyl-CoA synthetase